MPRNFPPMTAPVTDNPRDVADRIARRFIGSERVWGNYTLDLTLEALLAFDDARGSAKYLPHVQHVCARRNQPPGTTVRFETQPFCHVTYALYRATGDKRYVAPFLAESRRYYETVPRSPEGAVLHRCTDGGERLLIDMVQDYAARMARAGALSDSDALRAECVAQFRLYRDILRDPATGLYSQGRGWLQDPDALSPGAWSRGHGWLIRGMVASLEVLPPGSPEFRELHGYLVELCEALLARQDAGGMWHQLLHLPFEESFPETSGTALVCHALATALWEGFLEGDALRDAVLRAYRGVASHVDAQGVVHGACRGPGPLHSVDGYVRTPAAPDDPHGAPAVLFACAGVTRL
jgi:rhamnogalacturonyl hydrolase YesR